MIKLFYDLETTGTDVRKHSIHQISGIIEIDNEVVKEFDYKTRPHEKAKYEPEALNICGVTQEQLEAYPPMYKVHSKLVMMLSAYIDRYDPKQKMHLVGFNNRSFDDIFFRAWFEQCKDNFFGSWFWADSIDVLVLASQYLIDRRPEMSSFKLKRVAKELGLEIDESSLHRANYDVKITRQIYRIVTNLDFEL